MRRFAIPLVLLLASLSAHSATRLDILLTNDDGWNAAGISAMRAALCAAGHAVTLVGPATNQSGRGGSLNTGVLKSASFMSLTRQSSDACGASYSLAAPTAAGAYGGTPVDALSVGLDVLLARNPPDLVVSGLNFGQNMGMTISNASGTMGAAMQAALRGIPAIAGSVSMIFDEEQRGFPSTLTSFEPAAAFVARLIGALSEQGAIAMPPGVRLLNVNFPARYADVRGIALTRLATRADLETRLFDVSSGFEAHRAADPSSPDCLSLVDGASCSIGVGTVDAAPVSRTVSRADTIYDTEAVARGLISITPLDADMTIPVNPSGRRSAFTALRRLTKLSP